jgi:tetratricopeptide (TPR) repeat protein
MFLLTACATQTTAFDEGIRLYREGSYTAAREAFDSAARANPRSATSINNRGVARARLGDLDGAIADYTEAMRLMPTDPEFVFNRGNAYAAVGNYAGAINDFTAAVGLSPGYAQAYFNRGTIRAAIGDVPGAVTDWHWAADLERDPWTKAAMRRSAGLDYVSAMPASSRRSVRIPIADEIEAQVAPPPLDARALVARAMSREVDGDRLGAIADLREAATMETDTTRRERIDRLLRDLESAR